MKKQPTEDDNKPEKKKAEKGFSVTLYGFKSKVVAREHLKVLNARNDYTITGVQFGIIEKESYHIVNAFVVGAESIDVANKVVLNYLTRKISKNYVR